MNQNQPARRFLAISGDGDGNDFKVFVDAKIAYEHIRDSSVYQEIIAFSGEILSISCDSRGETILNEGKDCEQIYHWECGSVYVDTMGLAEEGE